MKFDANFGSGGLVEFGLNWIFNVFIHIIISISGKAYHSARFLSFGIFDILEVIYNVIFFVRNWGWMMELLNVHLNVCFIIIGLRS